MIQAIEKPKNFKPTRHQSIYSWKSKCYAICTPSDVNQTNAFMNPVLSYVTAGISA